MKVVLLKKWNNQDISNQEMLIQQIARTCYKKCDLPQTEEGASKFIKKYIIKQGHTSLLEHIWLSFKFKESDICNFYKIPNKIRKHLNIYANISNYTVSANYLTWSRFVTFYRELNIITTILQYMIPSIKYESKNLSFDVLNTLNIDRDDWKKPLAYTFKVTGCSRGFTHELVRHRENIVFSQQSTRYVNEKNFNFIYPPGYLNYYAVDYFNNTYKNMIDSGIRPGEARQYLPIGIESPIVFTCSHEELKYILDLRYHGIHGKPAWEIKQIMTEVKKIFNETEGN